MTMINDGYDLTYGKPSRYQRLRIFFWCSIGGISILTLLVLWIVLFNEGPTPPDLPHIKAPETSAKVYPQDAAPRDPLEGTSVYNRISSSMSSQENRAEEVKPLPAPEEPVPPLQEDEQMELQPEEQAQLEKLADPEETEERSSSDNPPPTATMTPMPHAAPAPQSQRGSISSSSVAPSMFVPQSGLSPQAKEQQQSPKAHKIVPISVHKQTDQWSTTQSKQWQRSDEKRTVFSHPIKGVKVQIASLETRERALQEWQRWQYRPLFEGLSVEIVRVDLGSTRGIYHRVYVGPFSSRSAAMRFAARLREKYRLDALVIGS
ncbi:MAG: SPOR domain-containing protein [Holosporales bacterium]|jgi:cell division septation protein DedD|nr:SPOR domain-containing protein [Holosporales bacterium]